MNYYHNYPTEERPWGKFEILVDSDYCKVKRITVNPGTLLYLVFKVETSFLSSSLKSAASFFPSIKIIKI